MFGIDHYFSFIAAILIFQAVPGPGTFTILAITARYGTKAGFSAMAGILLGDFSLGHFVSSACKDVSVIFLICLVGLAD